MALSGSPCFVKSWITPEDASAPNSALSGPRTTSMRSMPVVVKPARLMAPPGSFMGTPSTSTNMPVDWPPRPNTSARLPGRPYCATCIPGTSRSTSPSDG